MEFLRSFLRRYTAGKPVEASPNVGCFLRLTLFSNLFIRNVELSQRLYRIDTLLNGSLTSQIGFLVHLRVEVKFAKQLFYRLCETPFMIKRKQEKKITGNSGELITLSSQINLRECCGQKCSDGLKCLCKREKFNSSHIPP